MSDIQDIKTETKTIPTPEKYVLGKELNKMRIEELENINSFDMVVFKIQNPTLELIIDRLILGISRGKAKKFSVLTITEKEEVLKNLFVEKEEEI